MLDLITIQTLHFMIFIQDNSFKYYVLETDVTDLILLLHIEF